MVRGSIEDVEEVQVEGSNTRRQRPAAAALAGNSLSLLPSNNEHSFRWICGKTLDRERERRETPTLDWLPARGW